MMKRSFLGVCLLFLTLIVTSVSFAQIKSDQFFPDTTKGFFVISDIKALRSQWLKTELGGTLNSEPFAEFRNSLVGDLEKSWTGRFGMNIQDTMSMASGEISCGLIASPGKMPGFAIAIDITGKQKEVNDFLTKRIRQAFDSKLGTSKTVPLEGPAGTPDATELTLPPDDHYPVARTIYYLQTATYLLATDQKEILERLISKKGKALASVPAYVAVMNRCQKDFETPHEPLIRFFANPLEFGKAIYALETANQTKRGISPFDVLAKQGFNAIQGVGGTVDMASENFEFVSRVKIYIPPELKSSFKLLSFVDETDLAVPNWIGVDVNRTSLVNIDILNLFNNIGPLFDDFLETPGVWEDTLLSLEKDEQGPKVNLKTQLVANLGTRICTYRTFKDDEERFVGGIEIKKGKSAEVAEVFRRMFDTDPDFQKIDFNGGTIWVYSPAKKEVNRSRRTRNNSRRPQPAQKPESSESVEFIRNAFYVSDSEIFFSNDIEGLKDAVLAEQTGNAESLENSAAYRTVMKLIQSYSGPTGHYFQAFSANQTGFRINYELLKSGKFLEGKTLLSKITKRILSNPDQKVDETIMIDGSKLPPFETIADRVGPSGAFGQSENDGWFFKGFGVHADQVEP